MCTLPAAVLIGKVSAAATTGGDETSGRTKNLADVWGRVDKGFGRTRINNSSQPCCSPQMQRRPEQKGAGKDCSPRMCRPRSSRSGGRRLLRRRSSAQGQGRRHKRIRLRIQCMQGRQHGGGPSQHGRRLLEFHAQGEAKKILLRLRALHHRQQHAPSVQPQNLARRAKKKGGFANHQRSLRPRLFIFRGSP